MGLWGVTTAATDKPKFLPVDSNAAGSTGAREHAIAVKGGWGLAPGLAASGNDNTAAQPEVLVCVKNLAEAMGSASIIGIDWTDATVGDTGTFDITVTFDEAVDMTSAAWSANQTITNKAYILLSRVGKTDMVEDSTMACMYFSGSGTNQIVFRGTAQTNAAAGFLAFNGEGVGETGIVTGINFDGSATMTEEDGSSALSLRLEAGTAAAGSFGGKIIANGSAGAVATVNGALDGSTTLVVDGVSGTLAVGQVITVQDTSTAAISDADSNTAISTNNNLTITAVASQTSVTVSEAITVANNVVLLAMTNGGEEMIVDALGVKVAGPQYDSRSDITTITRVGADDSVALQLEEATTSSFIDSLNNDGGRLVQETGNAASETDGINLEGQNSFLTDPYVVETSVNDAATFLQSGSTSGTANILKGVDVAAS
jgi:filamentous hemagglutinin